MSEREEAERLYGLLDDISTLGDQMKPEQNAYFKAVNKLCEKRSGAITSDGYKLIWLPESSQSGVEFKIDRFTTLGHRRPDGALCLYEDVVKLVSENEALRSRCEKLEKDLEAVATHIEYAAEQVARRIREKP